MIKRILVALSGTPFTSTAVRHALELARTCDSEITGVTLMDLDKIARVGPVPIGGGAAAQDLVEYRAHITEEHITECIDGFQAACDDAGVPARIFRETGDPFDELISLWRYHDLTVVGLRGLFEYGVVANPADEVSKLIGKGVRPILAVAKEHRPIRRVIIAYDGSLESAKALKRFMQLSLWSDPQIRIACFHESADKADELLQAAAEYVRLYGVEAEIGHSSERVIPGLPNLIHDWNADLVVMGSSRRSRLAKLVLGDSVIHMLQHSDVPLFLTQ